jgi:hypothetical protein
LHPSLLFVLVADRRRRRWSLRLDLGLVGRAAAAAIDLGGRIQIAGLLRTAVGGLRRPLYPLIRCSGTGTRRRQQQCRAAAGAEFLFRDCGRRRGPKDGPRAGGASGRGGDRPRGSNPDRRAVAHSGWGSPASSLSVDPVQRDRHAAPTTIENKAAVNQSPLAGFVTEESDPTERLRVGNWIMPGL